MCEPTYRFHEIARVLANPSRRNRGVQWVFSTPVHCLQFSLRSTTRGPLAFAYVIEAQWGTHPDAGVTEGWHPPCAAATYQRGWAPTHWQSRFSMGLGNRPYGPYPEHTNRWTPIPLIRYRCCRICIKGVPLCTRTFVPTLLMHTANRVIVGRIAYPS